MLDLGSNSFHVLIADVFEDGTVVPVGREREMLHLGAAVQRHGHVPAAEHDLAVNTVAHLTELSSRMGAVDLSAVATSAIRDATNRDEIVAAMEGASGVPVRVIDGDEEARLSYLGVRASVATSADPLLVLDLGGGSLEFAVGRGLEVTTTQSVDLGVSRLSALVDTDPPLSSDDRGRLEALITSTLTRAVAGLPVSELTQTVAVGGTIRTLGRVVAAERDHWLPESLNQFDVSADHVHDLAERLCAMDAAARAEVPGMKSRRADHIHIAALVCSAMLRALDLDEFTLSDWGLREGVLLQRSGARPTTDPSAIRHREATRLRRTFVPDDPHLEHVADLTVQLFDGTRELHGRDDDDRDLLWCATALHDVGETLALRRHAQHGAYLVEHAELRGFSPRDTATVCSVVRFHTSRGCSTDFAPFAALRPEDRRRAEEFVALLQLADGLDRARDQAVRSVTVRLEEAVVVEPHGHELHVAVEEFARKTAVFERVFERPVELRLPELSRP